MEKEQFDKLLEKLTNIDSNIGLMNASMKMLSNRIAQLIDGLSSCSAPAHTPIAAPPPRMPVGPIAVIPGEKPVVKTEMIPDQTPPKNVSRSQRQVPRTGPTRSVITYKRVFGFIREDDSIPISDAVVFIYNGDNEVCSSTVSDPAGFWETMLNEGRYVVKITKDGKADINKMLIVDHTKKEFEVT